MKIQIDDTVRDATADEIAIIEKQNAQAQSDRDAREAQQAAAASARAKLSALGLTEAEVKALVG